MPSVLHVTTTDMSLELLLGPQLRAFKSAGYEVITASALGPWAPRLVADGIPHYPLEHATRAMAPLEDARALRELHSLFRHVQPDIVHTHNPKPGIYGRLAAKAARVPVVVNTVHGLYATDDDSRLKRAVVYSLERIAAACSDAELVQNPEDVDTLHKLRIPADRVHLLGNGVDLDRFAPTSDGGTRRAAVREQMGVGPDEIVVGAVGRLVLEKGYRELFDAMTAVRRSVPAARLVVVGPHEPDKSDAVDDSMMAAAKDAGVLFMGHRDDIHDLYAGMDLYVLASWREGFPRSAMEAAALALPIVTTDVRGCRQVVDHEHTGLIVPVRDAAQLGAAIERLAGSADERLRFGQAGLAKATKEFDQQQVIDITLATYRRLLGS